MRNIFYLMGEALNISTQGDSRDIPVGAILINSSGELLGKSQNQREKFQSLISHAEIEVIKQANQKLNNWRLTDCTMFVTLEPCLMCMGAILQSRIKKLYFGAFNKDNGFSKYIEKEKLKQFK